MPRLRLAHWVRFNRTPPLPGAELVEREGENFRWEIDITPEEIVALSEDYDVMLSTVMGQRYLFLDDKSRKFRQR